MNATRQAIGRHDRPAGPPRRGTRQIADTTRIAAPIVEVWDRTTDVESWPDHISTMTAVQRLTPGPLAVGSLVRIEQTRRRARTWTVTRVSPPHVFAWTTRLVGTTMTATHHLETVAGDTRNTLTIEFDGILASVVASLLRAPIRRALAIENAGLAAASERGRG